MDTLGIDENGFPVIIEYKRSANENVINQGLFYLDWLMDHRRDFEWLVLDKFDEAMAKKRRLVVASSPVHRRRFHEIRRARSQPDEPQHRADPVQTL